MGNLTNFSEATDSPSHSTNDRQIACRQCCARRLWKSLRNQANCSSKFQAQNKASRTKDSLMKAGIGRKISKGPSPKETSPLITHWIYGSLHPTHRYYHHKTDTIITKQLIFFQKKTRKYLQNTQKGTLIACLWLLDIHITFELKISSSNAFCWKEMTTDMIE